MKMVCLLIFCLNKILLCELLFPTTKLFGSNEDFFFFFWMKRGSLPNLFLNVPK